MKTHLVSLAVIAAALTGTAQAGELNMKAGNWSIDLTTTLMSQDFTDSFEECMTYEDAGLTGEQLAREYSKGAGCTAENITSSGNTVSFDMACEDPIMDGTSMKAVINYTSFEMTGDFETYIDGMGNLPGTLKLKGSHIGACS